MIKSKFAITLHILTFLAKNTDTWTTSKVLAQSVNINPVLIRKELSKLKTQKIISSKEGKKGGFKLRIKSSEIKLSEIFNIAKDNKQLLGFSKNKPNINCLIGSQINTKLTRIYSELDELIDNKFSKITLEEFKNRF